MDNKLLKQSNIKGTFQLDFYPVTQWSAIVDAPSFENNDDKVLNVTNNQLSWTGIKTINGESLFGDGNIEIIGTGTQSDWNINDIEDPAYIFNRTHYVEESVLNYNVEETSPENVETSDSWLYLLQNLTQDTESWDLSNPDNYLLACKNLSYNNHVFDFGELKHVFVEEENYPYYGNLFLAKDFFIQFGIDPEDTGEDYLLFVFAFAGVIFAIKKSLYQENASIVTNVERYEEVVHKLDNKFLNDIPTSKIDGLATVATTNDYYSLDNIPSMPSLGTLQTDVNYGLSPSQSESFSSNIQLHKISKTGNYNDLLSKPTKLSEFTNDVGYITSSEVEVYHGYEAGMVNDSTVRINLLIDDISKFTLQECLFDICFTQYGIPANGKLRFFDSQGRSYPLGMDPVDASVYYRTGTITSGIVNAGDEVIITNSGGLYVITNDAWNSTFSGDYNDLSNKPTIPVVPTDVSAFNNDAGYLTSYTETDPTVPSWAKQQSKPAYTANEVGAIPTTEKGANNGVATLGSDGRIPVAQLPSYVDDVLEYTTLNDFPATGESGKIYIAQDTNKTYRWSGSNYAEISESLALGETSSTAYAGDKGKANADAIRDLQRSVINGSYLESSPLYWYGESTTAAATVQKEVIIKGIDILNIGQIIVVQPTITSTVANSTLKLNNFDAYTMLYNNAAITTSTDSVVWNANYPTAWVFNGHYWVFLCHGLDSNTTYTINYSIDAGYYKAGSGTYAITRYSILAQKPDGTWEKITNTGTNYTTDTSKTANTSGFVLNQLKYYASTTTIAGGTNTATNVVYSKAASVDMRYSTNCGGTTNWALGEYVYLVGTVGADGLFYLDTTTWWTNSLPSSNDGKLYIRLGKVLTASSYTISFFDDRPVFYHNGTSIKEYKVADNKQDVISDLPTIRSGAAAGATAVQPSLLADVAISGSYNDLEDTPTIPAAQVNADWNSISGVSQILNKPTIPTVPTNVSAFTNDAGYTTNTGTITAVRMNGNVVASSGEANLGTVITSHQQLKTINNESIVGTGNLTVSGLPAVTASDNDKMLKVENGAWSVVRPVMIYSGTSAPSSSTGSNGDIYIQTQQ